MLNYTIKRIYAALLVLLAVTAITFFTLRSFAGSAAMLSLGTDASTEQLRQLERQLGLDLPWYLQYLHWLRSLLRFDLGSSLLYGEKVLTLILQRLPVTLSLSACSMLMSLSLALPLGIAAAAGKNRLPDILSRSLLQLGSAIPAFWLSLLLILFFSLRRKCFPASGFTPLSAGFLPYLRSIFLPSLTLSLAETAPLLRLLRTSMLHALSEDYIVMARVQGLPAHKIYLKYALRSSLTAPLSMAGIQFAKLLGGTTVVESVFALPGLGRLLLIAVEQRDLPLLQGCVVFITAAVVLCTLLVDLLGTALHPRTRLTEELPS